MAVDIEWVGIIENYKKTGDIRPLANLVRTGPIPSEHRESVSAILLGELAPDRRTAAVKSDYVEETYMAVIAYAKSMRDIHAMFRIDSSLQYDMQWVKRVMADACYAGNYETARRIINRKIKEGWPSLS